jgi:hypothetical protein
MPTPLEFSGGPLGPALDNGSQRFKLLRMCTAPKYTISVRAESGAERYAPERETHFVIGPYWAPGNPTVIGYTSEAEAVEMAARFNAGFIPARCGGCHCFVTEASGVCQECAHPWKPCGTVGCACNVPHGQRVCMECQKVNHAASEAAKAAKKGKVTP